MALHRHALVLLLLGASLVAACGAQSSSSFQIAESIPYGMEDLPMLPNQVRFSPV